MPEPSRAVTRFGRHRDLDQTIAIVHLDALRRSSADERGIEIGAARDRREHAVPVPERDAQDAPGDRAHRKLVDDRERGDCRRVEPQQFEAAQRAGRQAVATALVAGKARPVDEQYRAAGAGDRDRGGGTRRPTADDEGVNAAVHGAFLHPRVRDTRVIEHCGEGGGEVAVEEGHAGGFEATGHHA